MSKKSNIVKEILSWVLLVTMFCLMVFTIYSSAQAKKNDEPFFLFGYRPILVLTGSMEPYMLTNGLCLTKEVTSIDQLEVGDVITYQTTNSGGNIIRITHRIIALDNGQIFTKGDNNHVDDGFALSIDNVESKVVLVLNGTAWLYQKWQTTPGKIMIISFAIGVLLFCSLLKSWLRDKRKAKEEEDNIPASDDGEILEGEIVESEEVKTEIPESKIPESKILEPSDDGIKS